MEDFESVLDSKGKPQPNKFDYKYLYLEDNGVPADIHSQAIPLENFDICWAPDPEQCPPYFFYARITSYNVCYTKLLRFTSGTIITSSKSEVGVLTNQLTETTLNG